MQLDDAAIEDIHSHIHRSRRKFVLLLVILAVVTLAVFLVDKAFGKQDWMDMLRGVWPALLVILLITAVDELFIREGSDLEWRLRIAEMEQPRQAVLAKYVDLKYQEYKRDLLSAIYSADAARETLSVLLRDRLKDKNLVDEYLHLTLDPLYDGDIWQDLQVTNILQPDPSVKGAYKLIMNQRFYYRSSRKGFLILCADNNQVLNILHSSPSICDFIIATYGAAEPSKEGAFLDMVRLNVFKQDHTGSNPVAIVPEKLRPRDLQKLLEPIGLHSDMLGEVRGALFSYPRETESVQVEFQVSMPLNLADGYMFWSAPRTCCVKEIVFQYDGIARDVTNVSVQQFFANPKSNYVRDDSSNVISIYYNNGWMLRGHGAMLKWEPVRETRASLRRHL